MGKNESIFIISGIIAGVAVAGSLFLLYPDMMFKDTNLAQQSGVTPDVYGGSPATTTAGVGANDTNSTTSNTTTGSPAPTAAPPY
ncbi:MAG: hypothetical protein AUJ08_00470 [Thaumarchaeota archaeon 13_1_40CM_3_50_5]|nr:MAG: hypothetical protein AUJ08_00470 [Thaumarchaeota archaeon 13_1_40CM_3_50_5]